MVQDRCKCLKRTALVVSEQVPANIRKGIGVKFHKLVLALEVISPEINGARQVQVFKKDSFGSLGASSSQH